MAGFELTEFVLLACEFRVVEPRDELAATTDEGEPDAEAEGKATTQSAEGSEQAPASERPEGFPAIHTLELPGVRIDYGVTEDEEDDEFVVILEANLLDPSAPYQLHVVGGGRVTRPDDPRVETDAAASTLVFLCYPYLRELVSNITAKSPYQATFLPPLTKLPHPRVAEPDPEPDVPPADE